MQTNPKVGHIYNTQISAQIRKKHYTQLFSSSSAAGYGQHSKLLAGLRGHVLKY